MANILPSATGIGDLVGGAGHAIGLPDFGISEFLGGQPHNLNQPSQGYTGPSATDLGSVLGQVGRTQSQQNGPGPGVPETQLGTSISNPYAQYGGQSRYNGLVSAFGTQHQNLLNGADQAGQNAGLSYKNSILDLVNQLQQGQNALNNRGIQAALAKQQGSTAARAAVGRGIQSGASTLANRNAGDSSAAQAIANAYSDIGRRQLSQVGNQFAQAQFGIGQDQQALNNQQSLGQGRLADSKVQMINNIVSDAQNQLAALDAAMANASLPDRINIEQEKNGIRQKATDQLQQFDSLLGQGLSNVHPMDQQATLAQANQLATAGTAPEQAFNFTAAGPAQFAGSGPFDSNLPLFSLRGGRRAV